MESKWFEEGVPQEDKDRRGGPAQKYGKERQGDT
jgi:hypothetical protein